MSLSISYAQRDIAGDALVERVESRIAIPPDYYLTSSIADDPINPGALYYYVSCENEETEEFHVIDGVVAVETFDELIDFMSRRVERAFGEWWSPKPADDNVAILDG